MGGIGVNLAVVKNSFIGKRRELENSKKEEYMTLFDLLSRSIDRIVEPCIRWGKWILIGAIVIALWCLGWN